MSDIEKNIPKNYLVIERKSEWEQDDDTYITATRVTDQKSIQDAVRRAELEEGDRMFLVVAIQELTLQLIGKNLIPKESVMADEDTEAPAEDENDAPKS